MTSNQPPMNITLNSYISFSDPAFYSDTVDPNNAPAIIVTSWSQNFKLPETVTTPTPVNGPTPDLAIHSGFTFTKNINSATPALLFYCWSARLIPQVVFTTYLSNNAGWSQKYLQISMSNIFIFNIDAGWSGGQPTETVSLKYETISYAYSLTDPDNHPRPTITLQNDLKQGVISMTVPATSAGPVNPAPYTAG